MTVLSGAFSLWNAHFRVFGIAQTDVLECLNCPVVKDVQVRDRALETPRHDVGAVAERLLVE
jgi:hypothetical protein